MWTVVAALGSFLSAATSWSWWRAPASRASRIADAAVSDVHAEADRTREVFRGPERRLERETALWEERARQQRLVATPVEQLRDAGAERVRWAALRTGGVETLADVRAQSVAELKRIEGVGEATAKRLSEAAVRLEEQLDQVAVPLPGSNLEEDGAEDLARAALDAVEARRVVGDALSRLEREEQRLDGALAAVKRQSRFAAWLGRRVRRQDDDKASRAARRVARDAFDVVEGDLGDRVRDARTSLAARRSASSLSRAELTEAWRREHAEVATSIARAQRTAASSVDAAVGTRLPDDIVARVLALDFTPRGLRVDLRRYQDFGSRYIVVQERTVLGDDMGLGKTMQSLAAMCHLMAQSNATSRFLAVVPATVVHGWAREVEKFTELDAFLVHGSSRLASLEAWKERGGLAITSYTTLAGLGLAQELEDAGQRVELLVADEAHYIKNPDATRSRALAALLPLADRVCLMTGTPLENRLEEFQHILRLVRPDLPALAEVDDERSLAWSLDPDRFALDVAEAYLRRNQRDVLVELPERIDTDHWIDVGHDEQLAYRDAVGAGNVMAMRRAVTIGDWKRGEPEPAVLPTKVRHAVELIREAQAAGRKTLVFSYFLDVLEFVGEQVDVLGVVRGDVGPAERQRLLDEFTASSEPAVMLGQITAAGVGLNIQAASVVVLMEPQWKPSTEEQAIARAHRMGQPDVVLVHRLLARDGIDERISELLADKYELFERFVTPSAIRTASRESTEPALAKLVLDAERARLEVDPPPHASAPAGVVEELP